MIKSRKRQVTLDLEGGEARPRTAYDLWLAAVEVVASAYASAIAAGRYVLDPPGAEAAEAEATAAHARRDLPGVEAAVARWREAWLRRLGA